METALLSSDGSQRRQLQGPARNDGQNNQDYESAAAVQHTGPAQLNEESASAQCSNSASPALAAADQALNEDFIPTTSFTGAVDGFVFTTGAHGTGYYKDKPLHLRQKQAQAKPVVLKTNTSIIKGLQRRGPVSAPDAKKAKTDSNSKPNYLKEMERYRSMACSSDTKHDRPLVK